MKKPIVITDLAQLGAALEWRAHITGAEMIEAFHTQDNRKPYSEALHLSYDMGADQRTPVMSATSNDGVIWFDEASNIDPETWKELHRRNAPLGVWITGADELFKIENPNT